MGGRGEPSPKTGAGGAPGPGAGGPAVPGAHGPQGPFCRPLSLGRGGWPRGAITQNGGGGGRRVAPWGGGQAREGGPAVPGAHGPPGPFCRPLSLGRGGWPRGAITSKRGRGGAGWQAGSLAVAESEISPRPGAPAKQGTVKAKLCSGHGQSGRRG